MRVLVTGAGGFLGQAVVRQVCAAGHDVTALVRPLSDVTTFDWPADVSILRGDLRQPGGLADRWGDVDAVVHLAAAATGDLSEQFAGTVVATENLLRLLPWTSLARFVLISTFSVYDYSELSINEVVDERSPCEDAINDRDPYTVTKLLQEELVRRACAAAAVRTVVIRPGAIFGPGKDWNYGAASRVGPLSLVFSPRARFRLTYIDNCADAITLAIDRPLAHDLTVNVVDDHLPTHAEFFKACRRQGADVGFLVPVPWCAVALSGRALRFWSVRRGAGPFKLPEVVSYRRQQARWKPLRYSNEQAKASLGWEPKVQVPTGIERTVRRPAR